MKAERRHELKTNALASKLETAPAFFQQYGTRILLGIVFVLLGYILFQKYQTDKQVKAETAARDLGTAMYALNQLKMIPFRASPEQIAGSRKEFFHDAENAITDVLSNSDDPKIRAEAFVVSGDLNWTLANFPELREAATRPSLKADKSSDDYLTAAAGAYKEVLSPPLDSDEQSRTAARLSLGKIAENRSQWDDARKYYQQVVDDSAAGAAFKERAQEYIDGLAILSKPMYAGTGDDLGPPSIPQPPETFGPFAPHNLSTAPTTGIVIPPAATTAPATQSTISGPTTVPAILLPASRASATTQPSQP